MVGLDRIISLSHQLLNVEYRLEKISATHQQGVSSNSVSSSEIQIQKFKMKGVFTTCQTLFVLLVTGRCLCLIRLPCKFYADFSIILNNTADTGTIMKTISSRTVRQCTLECLSWPKCLSLNYNRGTMTCELLERRFNESVPLLTHRADRVYMTTDDGKFNVSAVVVQISKSFLLNKAKP